MKKGYKALYDESLGRLALAEADATFWQVRAEAIEQEIFELRTKLFEFSKSEEALKTELVETKARVPNSSLQTDNDNLRKINSVYKQMIFGEKPSLFTRFRLFILGLPIKIENK